MPRLSIGDLLRSTSTIVRWLLQFPAKREHLNRNAIHLAASLAPARPHPFSLWSPSTPATPLPEQTPATQPNVLPNPPPPGVSDYTSWPGLVDRSFTGRHLPPYDQAKAPYQPDVAEVVPLFKRGSQMSPDPKSSALFCFFAQWFTDSFLRTHPLDLRRNTSNHEIDLCQIYGLDEPSTWALRARQGGRLKSRQVDGQEFPVLLFKGGEIDPQFYDAGHGAERGLSYLRAGRDTLWKTALENSLAGTISNPARRDFLYAAGLDRGSSTIVYSAFNTIFLREHNRIALELAKANKGWDDDRLFETARLINIRQILTVVVNDYIRHISVNFPFTLDRTFAESKPWYRTNRITVEFNLLYRWHALVPDALTIAGERLDHTQYRFNNALLERHGVEQIINDASVQPAGRVGLFNTPDLLSLAEGAGVKFARDFRLRPFNEYRRRFGLDPYASIDEFGDGPRVVDALKSLYKNDMNAVEFTVGLLAEKREPGLVMPETLGLMVAHDAFTHILTNPVLANEVHNRETFSDAGLDIVEKNASLGDIIGRNTKKPVKPSLSYKTA